MFCFRSCASSNALAAASKELSSFKKIISHTNRLCSIYSAFRCPPSNPCPHDCQYYRYTGRPGCGLHGNEVHQLWRRWQNTQVPHCHDWRYHHPGWRWEDLYFFFFLCMCFCLFFVGFLKKKNIVLPILHRSSVFSRCLLLVRSRHHPGFLQSLHPRQYKVSMRVDKWSFAPDVSPTKTVIWPKSLTESVQTFAWFQKLYWHW